MVYGEILAGAPAWSAGGQLALTLTVFWKALCRRRHGCPRERYLVPIRLTNMPLWLYFRSVSSSEKSVKL